MLLSRKSVRVVSLMLSFASLVLGSVFAQAPSQKEQIRLQIWAELDPFPGRFEDEGTVLPAVDKSEGGSEGEESAKDSVKGQKRIKARNVDESVAERTTNAFTGTAGARDISIFQYAIDRAKEIAPFLMSGMIYGWSFDYVPYDKTRHVDEYFEFAQIHEHDPAVNKISYHNPQAIDDRLMCWAYCNRTPSQQLAFERWSSIVHPKITGHGSASVEDGFEGIKAACSEAVKNAVREYWRTMEKNKPKEIYGTVLLIQDPRIYIKQGKYIVELDFFLKTDRIILYTYY